MSRYRGPRKRIIRKLDNLPGFTSKRVDIENSIKTPGQHGKQTRFFLKNRTSYGLRLLEKQKLRFNYHLTEKQFVGYVNAAKRSSKPTGDVLLSLLEMRLDSVIYRLGMAPTIVAARQLVTHGHVLIDQKKVTIPSYNCRTKQIISIKDHLRSRQLIQKNLKAQKQNWRPPKHLGLNRKNLVGSIKRLATRHALQFKINELLVIEYYSQK